MDRLTAGYKAGQVKAEEEQIIKRHAGERARRQELKKAQQNPSKVGILFGEVEAKTRPARQKITKAGKKAAPKVASGAKKAYGALVDYYDEPKTTSGAKRTVKKARKRGGSQTVKVVHVHVGSGGTTKRRKKNQSNDDDFFSSRGFNY